jgi:kynurenine formamidase
VRLATRPLIGASIVSLLLAVVLAFLMGLPRETASGQGILTQSERAGGNGQDGVQHVTPPPVPITTADLLRWRDEFSNWHRWDNQLGAANFITQKKRQRALRLANRGITISLEHPLLKVPFDPALPFHPVEPLPPAAPIATTTAIAPLPTIPLDPDNGNPFFHWMNPAAYTSDRYNVSYHGTAHSHLDALCHFPITPLGRLFDGVVTTANNSPDGCTRFGIENLRDGVVTKGVLFDATLLPHLREPGRPWLAPGTHVHKSDLETLERIEHVRVESGDVILLYTGRWARRAALGPWPTSGSPTAAGVGVAGYDADAMEFVHEREVSFIGHDEWNDAFPNGYPGVESILSVLPVHALAIAVMGVDIFDNLDLERLAQAARQQKSYEFLFVAAPMQVPGGTGSPLNPLAIF